MQARGEEPKFPYVTLLRGPPAAAKARDFAVKIERRLNHFFLRLNRRNFSASRASCAQGEMRFFERGLEIVRASGFIFLVVYLGEIKRMNGEDI